MKKPGSGWVCTGKNFGLSLKSRNTMIRIGLQVDISYKGVGILAMTYIILGSRIAAVGLLSFLLVRVLFLEPRA